MAKQAFVTGWPVTHSRSPQIHRYWLNKYGIAGDYRKYPVEPEAFEGFLLNLKASEFVGGNVTIPHKETAFDLVERRDPVSASLGAVNTVWLDDGVLCGANTDGLGFLGNLDQQAPGWDSPDVLQHGALVLGAGGASRAIIYSLQQRGFSRVVIANRTLEKAENLAQHFGDPCEAVALDNAAAKAGDVRLMVNTTSVGMGDGKSPIDLTGFRQDTLINDIVYTPLITPILKQARSLGMLTVDGLGMLLHQAVPGFERWFGVRPEVTEELRNLVLADLGEEA